jgi:hypothetical protein
MDKYNCLTGNWSVHIKYRYVKRLKVLAFSC